MHARRLSGEIAAPDAPAYRRITLGFGLVALLFGAVLVVIAVIASQSLMEREEAVREGVMLRAGHELERALRESGPSGATAVLEEFVARPDSGVTGVEIAAEDRIFARAGEIGESTVEMPIALGPAWRGLAGRGDPGRRGVSPFLLRLGSAHDLSRQRLLSRAIVIVAVVTALALVALAIAAGSGLARRAELAAIRSQNETFRALAAAGAGLAHRIRNPLASIKGTAQLLAESSDGKAKERADRVVEASDRIDRTLAELLQFARPPEAHPESLAVVAILNEVFGGGDHRVAVTGVDGVTAWADREHLIQIVEELVANARAFDPEGILEVSVGGGDRWCSIDVADRGPGLGLDAAQAFEPYVTSRPDGTGLGLPIVRALAAANGGRITLRPRDGGGTVATLRLLSRSDR
ncbi:MAG: sensor histidine kinase [Thermoanaerobaculia bacterium]